jgi:hypothetical protein
MKQTIFKTEYNIYIIVNWDIDIFKREYEDLTKEHWWRKESTYTNFFKKLRLWLKQYWITFTEYADVYHAFSNHIEKPF